MAGASAREVTGETQPIASVPELYGSTPAAEVGDPCPMEPETYKAVCEFHGMDILAKFPPTQFEGRFAHQFSPEELMVRQDLAKNKFRWSDDYYQDRQRFLNQLHPLIALFRSHRLHTISRQERAVVYIVQIFFVLLVSLTFPFAERCGAGMCETIGDSGVGPGQQCLFPFTYKGKTYETCTTEHVGQLWCSVGTDSDGQHIKGQWGHCFCQRGLAGEECWKIRRSSGQRHVHAVLCCLAHHTGVEWFATTFQIWGMNWGGTVYASVLNTFFSIGSFQLMLCGCVQRASDFVRQCGEHAGHVMYAVLTILILLPQPYLIMYAFENSLLLPTMWVFITSKVASYTAITLLQLSVFHFIWDFQGPECHEDIADGTKIEKTSRECMSSMRKFHVTSDQYEVFLRNRRESRLCKPAIDNSQT